LRRRVILDVILLMSDSHKISNADAAAIQQCVKYASMLRRGIATETEIVTSLFNQFHGCESDFAIEQCVAQLPEDLHREIQLQANIHGQKHHPGDLFVFHPDVPTADELLALDARVRHIFKVVFRYLANPTGNTTYQIDENDLPRKRWLTVRHFDTISGTVCKTAKCNNERIESGVFCPAHHYEMLYGTPPPNAG